MSLSQLDIEHPESFAGSFSTLEVLDLTCSEYDSAWVGSKEASCFDAFAISASA